MSDERNVSEMYVQSELNDSEVRRDRVNRVLDHAKLKREELKSTSQLLSFSRDVADNNVLLLELNATLLDHITKGDVLTFRGDETDHAVLCTKDRTYSVKEAETSNSLLLLHQLTFPNEVIDDGTEPNLVSRQVVGVHHTYLEVTPCKPRLRMVRELLEQNKYLGREHELDNQFQNFTTADLLDRVQASERELQICLRNIEAYNMNGYWRLLDFDYNCRLVMHILNLLEENSWSYKSVPRDQVLDTLEELEPRNILEQCLDYHVDSSLSQSADNLCCLNEEKICCFFAEIMLKQAGKFNLQEFCESWKQCVPEGMTANLEQLKGLVLIDRLCSPEVISLFPVCEMPEDITGRFNYLFQKRIKWTFEDISPFIEDLTSETLDVNALLTKYSRVSTVNGVRHYTSKRPLY